MNKQELIERLEDIEWEDFEVKEAKSELPKSSWETVSAFANTAGGWIIFGVKQNKEFEIQGVKNAEKIEQDFTTTLRNGTKFNQKIIPKSKKYQIDKKTILAFYILLSEKKPVYFNSPKNTFIRTASGDQRLTAEEVDSLYRQSAYGTKDKEKTKLTINDLDKNTIKQYRQYLKNTKPEHQYNTLADEDFLTKIRAIDDKKVTIAGLLVFGNEDSIANYFSDFKIDYLEIFGTSYEDATKRYEFRMPGYPNLFQFFFAIYERIIKKIDVPFKLKGAFRDENQPQVKAIREALVNLLIHSDYHSPMKPRIRVFTNRIEFFNPGALPKPYEELQKGDISLPRNPLITKMFRVIDLAENAGYGFDKMIKGWQEHYKTKPTVSGGIDNYRIEFFFEETTPQATPQATPQDKRTKKILAFCREPKTREEIQSHININDVKYFRTEILKPLLNRGLLLLTIPDKPTSPNQKYHSKK